MSILRSAMESQDVISKKTSCGNDKTGNAGGDNLEGRHLSNFAFFPMRLLYSLLRRFGSVIQKKKATDPHIGPSALG